MHSHFNERLVNKNTKQGNVAAYFDNLSSLVQVNDGTRSFVLKTVDCHDQSAPFNDSQETRIAITHSDHQISQITDGFLTFKVKLMLQLSGFQRDLGSSPTITKDDDRDHMAKIFVGFKSSNQVFDQMQILCRNLSTDYQQNECCREGFAYSTIKPKQEKKTKKYTHSLYENVADYSPSVCGTYINILDFKDGQPHPVEFEMNVPFDDILPLQAFDLYPNSIVGDIELKFYVKPRGLVWCQVDPRRVSEVKEFMEDKVPISIDSAARASTDMAGSSGFSSLSSFYHGFTQIGNEARAIDGFYVEKITDGNYYVQHYNTGNVRLDCVGMSVLSLKSNMYGFNVQSESLEKIYNIFRTPQVIPAQQLDYNAFPIAATPAGIQSTINMPVCNTTCISVMFPKHPNDYTVFENPMYSNLQLTVNGKNMPDEVIDSQGGRFLQQQLIASDLSGGLECTKEFEDSMVMTKNNADDNGKRYKNPLSDGTSFMWNVQTERNGGGYIFDGIDSNGQNIPIQIRGQPLYTGENDTYYNYDLSSEAHPPPPQLWLCRDTYFLASTDGLKYVAFDTPSGSQV